MIFPVKLKDLTKDTIYIPSEIDGIRVTEIGEGAFSKCLKLSSVDFSANTILSKIKKLLINIIKTNYSKKLG